MDTATAYRIESVETCKAPRGLTHGDWCRYVVANGSSRIVGRYCGSLTQTRRNAEDLVKGLNARARNGKSPWAPRGQKTKAARH